MDVLEAIKSRYSVRRFEDRKIEQGKLEKILEAGQLAPSASNRQEWRFIVVREKVLRQELAKAANNQGFVARAPVVIAACGVDADYVMRCGHPAYLVDVTIAVDHLTLKAAEEVGYPAATPGSKHKKRKELPEIVMYNQWGGK